MTPQPDTRFSYCSHFEKHRTPKACTSSLETALANVRNRLARERGRAERAEAALARAAYVARNLLGMIPREAWREQGGDDGQGHYEGDYYAERAQKEIDEWEALSGGGRP